MKKLALFLLLFVLWFTPVAAQEPSDKSDKPAGETTTKTTIDAQEAPAKEPAPKPEADKKEPDKKEPERSSVTEGAVTVEGKEVRYRATAGTLPILKPDGKPSAQMFYVSYVLRDEIDPAERPVTFCFNGGPGSSSVWLHLGAFGPRRVEMPGDGTTAPPPPGKLVSNEYSILDVTDLVFIDPVSTGFSRAEDPQKAGEFHSQSEDVASVAEFIRLWVTREKRWRSPKFLAGESYGAFRAAGLANHLQSRHNMHLNGIALISGLVDFETINGSELSGMSYEVFLPALTATAHYHKKLPAELQADLAGAMKQVREFADGQYARALRLGADLPAEERKEIVGQLARFTGLPAEKIDEQDLRISTGFFREMLLRDQNRIVGRFDGRATSRDGSKSQQAPEFDPSFTAISGAFSATMNAYLSEELNFEKDFPYEILNRLNWNFGQERSYPSTRGELASAMKENPHLRVLVLCGLRDLACPPEGIRLSIRHLNIPLELRAGLRVEEYESGHMMYLNPPDMKKMRADMKTFLTQPKAAVP